MKNAILCNIYQILQGHEISYNEMGSKYKRQEENEKCIQILVRKSETMTPHYGIIVITKWICRTQGLRLWTEFNWLKIISVSCLL
jgi:hypothetical protein